jgi:hypothetical protein
MSANEPREIPDLETPCEACAGRGGWRRADDSWARCPECDGRRLIPTEFGIKVLDFLRRNSTPEASCHS